MKPSRWTLIDLLTTLNTVIPLTIVVVVAYQATARFGARQGGTLPMIALVGLFLAYVVVGLALLVGAVAISIGPPWIVAWLVEGIRRLICRPRRRR